MENSKKLKTKSLSLAIECLSSHLDILDVEVFRSTRLLLKAGFKIVLDYDPKHDKLNKLICHPGQGPEVVAVESTKFLKLVN